MIKFEKISYKQFKEDIRNVNSKDFHGKLLQEDTIKDLYNNIKIPKRATSGSAGYDFYTPIPIYLSKNDTIVIPTGIRVQIDTDKFLMCCPKSSLGFKYRIQLDNTIGIIDSDYYNSNNEGHILIKITNDSKNKNTLLELQEGKAFAQGLFLQYYTTDDDNSDGIRNGGFGSTNS